MSIHKEGFVPLAITGILLMVFNAFFWALFPLSPNVSLYTGAASLIIFIMILQFFRDPKRTQLFDDGLLIAPADGKVVIVEEADEPEYYKGKRLQVSIFMSPVNVHINRSPVAGIVKFFKYHPGQYLVAWHPKSSTLNERTTMVVESGKNSVLVRQIAGAVARRIRWYVEEGQELKQNEEFGFIKFGSRVDLFLPTDAKVLVKPGDVVRGGVSKIASWK